MVRTIISLEPDDKTWLDKKARSEGVPMSSVVRKAIQRLRKEETVSLSKLLNQTSGIWRKGDGLAFQRRLRKEWR